MGPPRSGGGGGRWRRSVLPGAGSPDRGPWSGGSPSTRPGGPCWWWGGCGSVGISSPGSRRSGRLECAGRRVLASLVDVRTTGGPSRWAPVEEDAVRRRRTLVVAVVVAVAVAAVVVGLLLAEHRRRLPPRSHWLPTPTPTRPVRPPWPAPGRPDSAATGTRPSTPSSMPRPGSSRTRSATCSSPIPATAGCARWPARSGRSFGVPVHAGDIVTIAGGSVHRAGPSRAHRPGPRPGRRSVHRLRVGEPGRGAAPTATPRCSGRRSPPARR